jgi:hypothetical protein
MNNTKELFSNEYLKIIEDKNIAGMFKIEFTYSNMPLINSLVRTKIINGATITDDYKGILFKSFSLKSFQQYKKERTQIGFSDALHMVYSLTSQLNYLINNQKHTFLGYNHEYLFVINNTKFIYLDSENLKEISNNKILISSPFYKNDFIVSPELLKIKTIPSYVHFKTTYFSLAFLILYALSNSRGPFYESELYKNYLHQNDDFGTILSKYKNTKLQYLLSRCLVEEPTKRSILFI